MSVLKSGKWRLAFRVIPIVIIIILLKLLSHQMNWEFLTLNSLFGAIISANVFLVGFLISGVLVDYKEAEKLPGELACSLEVMTDECYITYKNKKNEVAKDLLRHVHNLTGNILEWLHKKVKTNIVLKGITDLNDYFLALEHLLKPTSS